MPSNLPLKSQLETQVRAIAEKDGKLLPGTFADVDLLMLL
jgi:hypothetical protein